MYTLWCSTIINFALTDFIAAGYTITAAHIFTQFFLYLFREEVHCQIPSETLFTDQTVCCFVLSFPPRVFPILLMEGTWMLVHSADIKHCQIPIGNKCKTVCSSPNFQQLTLFYNCRCNNWLLETRCNTGMWTDLMDFTTSSNDLWWLFLR